jgi:hypothetical protein
VGAGISDGGGGGCCGVPEVRDVGAAILVAGATEDTSEVVGEVVVTSIDLELDLVEVSCSAVEVSLSELMVEVLVR